MIMRVLQVNFFRLFISRTQLQTKLLVDSMPNACIRRQKRKLEGQNFHCHHIFFPLLDLCIRSYIALQMLFILRRWIVFTNTLTQWIIIRTVSLARKFPSLYYYVVWTNRWDCDFLPEYLSSPSLSALVMSRWVSTLLSFFKESKQMFLTTGLILVILFPRNNPSMPWPSQNANSDAKSHL